jgi:hypothetical protein
MVREQHCSNMNGYSNVKSYVTRNVTAPTLNSKWIQCPLVRSAVRLKELVQIVIVVTCDVIMIEYTLTMT